MVILGGSHSAFSAVWALTNLLPDMFSLASIQLLYRNRLRIFYPSAEEALLDSYSDFTAEDICPVTHRVFRLDGLRGDARQVWRRLARRPGTEPESRVVLQPINALSPSVLRAQLEAADLIICALGYRPHTIPFFDAGGRRVLLYSGHARTARKNGRVCPCGYAETAFRYSE